MSSRSGCDRRAGLQAGVTWQAEALPAQAQGQHAQTAPGIAGGLALRLGIGFYLGYAELTEEKGKTHRYNAAVLVDAGGRIVGKYRKVHLPGSEQVRPALKFQQLEKRYFEYGNLGLPVKRRPESDCPRVLASLAGAVR